tara:strand:+ start:4260 stop:5111 length:852 start_codon:yes stop_codon:yes gene_type:complete
MELLPLSDYYRKASLGYEYPELSIEYNDWSHDLHLKGNYIDNEKLKTMSINGLIRWYFKKLSFFTIDYNYRNIERFIDNPQNIEFYDIKCINKIATYFRIHNDFISNLNLENYNYKYKFLFSKYNYTAVNKTSDNKNIVSKYSNCKFGVYLIDYMEYDNLKEYLINIYTEYLKLEEFFNGTSLFDNFLKLYPKIIDWGIIYHKFKVVLEKISRQKHKDIYEVDSFVDKVQQYIFTLVSKYFENILLNQNCDIYIKDEENLYKDKYFQAFPDEILKDFDFTTII